VWFSLLSRIKTGASHADDSASLRAFYGTHKKNKSHASDHGTEFNEAVRSPSSSRRRRQSALSPLRRASRSTRSKHIAHPAMSRNRFCSAANVTRRMLSYVSFSWKYPRGGFVENEITVQIFSENKDASRIFFDIFCGYRLTLRIFCGNILKNICLKKGDMLARRCKNAKIWHYARSRQYWHIFNIFNPEIINLGCFYIPAVKKMWIILKYCLIFFSFFNNYSLQTFKHTILSTTYKKSVTLIQILILLEMML